MGVWRGLGYMGGQSMQPAPGSAIWLNHDPPGKHETFASTSLYHQPEEQHTNAELKLKILHLCSAVKANIYCNKYNS